MILRACDYDTFLTRLHSKQLVCFGAGKLLTDFLEEFPEIKERVTYIVDNNDSLWNTKKTIGNFSLDVRPPSYLYENFFNTVLLITCRFKFAYEIILDLTNNKRMKNVDCYIGSFVRDLQSDKQAYVVNSAPVDYRANKEMVIPKKIHYVWVGGNPLPKSAVDCIKSWRYFNPDYEIIEWNESNYDFSKNRYMNQAYEEEKWAFVSDYASLDIVYTHGGIYLDTDVETLKSFDELLYNTAFCGFECPSYVNLGSGFGGLAGFSLFKEMRDGYDNILFRTEDGNNLTPVGIYSTQTLKRHGLIQDGSFQVIKGLTVYPPECFAPLSNHTGHIYKSANSYSIHLYDASWFPKDEKTLKKLYLKTLNEVLDNEKNRR